MSIIGVDICTPHLRLLSPKRVQADKWLELDPFNDRTDLL